ncbi:MBL fold metallo-hydrolase [Myxococcota bacterium]|nr:MBL fold metallo-hydrolase [Myxococcota bacterium]MBU1432869.1 MBL fold metallo-hydrolase [Myxococcota bacterium]MBU1898582.1 MBL fold metallo-hydrolase [Myxococcota bacterium]
MSSSIWLEGGRFQNLDGLIIPPRGGLRRLLRWRLGPRAAPELEGGADIPAAPIPITADLHAPTPLEVTWVGHATTLIRAEGTRILTDPVFGDVGFGRVKRLAPPALSPAALPPLDAICLSHNHYDHCDLPSLRALRALHPAARIIAPEGLDGWLRARLGDPVEALPWWSSVQIGAVEVTATPAQHWSVRGPHDRCKSHWCGFLFAAPAGRIFFSGDTGFGPHFEAIAARGEVIDLAVMGIGAYAPRWFMRDQHMGPEEAVAACQILGASMLAMHYGAYQLSDEPLNEPPRLARRAAEALGVTLYTPPPGGAWRAGLSGEIRRGVEIDV